MKNFLVAASWTSEILSPPLVEASIPLWKQVGMKWQMEILTKHE